MLVVYTVVFGAYDPLRPPLKVLSKKARYVCLSDKKYDVEPWESRIVEIEESNPRLQALRCKTLSHFYFPEAESSLFLAGSVQLQTSAAMLAYRYLRGADIAAGEAWLDDCVYEFAARLIDPARKVQKWPAEPIARLVAKLREDQFPEHFGRPRLGALIRRHSDEIAQFNELWWSLIQEYSAQDQLSFPYASWKLDLRWNSISRELWTRYFVAHPHEG